MINFKQMSRDLVGDERIAEDLSWCYRQGFKKGLSTDNTWFVQQDQDSEWLEAHGEGAADRGLTKE